MADVYPEIKECIGNIVEPIIFELGSNDGSDTIKLLETFNPQKLITFECDPHHIKTIRGLNLPITLVEKAIGSTTGNAKMYQSFILEEFGASSSIKKPKNHLEKFPFVTFPVELTVETITLDDYCAEEKYQRIDFIWADIQGAEIDMIRGGMRTLSMTKFLLTEYSDDELYEGQARLGDVLNALPGRWRVVKDYMSDVLLENISYKGA